MLYKGTRKFMRKGRCNSHCIVKVTLSTSVDIGQVLNHVNFVVLKSSRLFNFLVDQKSTSIDWCCLWGRFN